MSLSENEAIELYELGSFMRQIELDESKDSVGFLSAGETIPLEALSSGHPKEYRFDPFSRVTNWIVDHVSERAGSAHTVDDLLNKADQEGFDVPPEIIHRLYDVLNGHLSDAYSPGFTVMSRIHAVVPLVAAREGIDDREEWADIASKARRFGRKLVGPYTGLQATFVDVHTSDDELWLGNFDRFDHRLFKLDDKTGITTTYPIDEVTNMILQIRKDSGIDTHARNVLCPAVTTAGVVERTLYDDYWTKVTDFVGEHIYPGLLIPSRLRAPYALHEPTIENMIIRAVRHELTERGSEPNYF